MIRRGSPCPRIQSLMLSVFMLKWFILSEACGTLLNADEAYIMSLLVATVVIVILAARWCWWVCTWELLAFYGNGNYCCRLFFTCLCIPSSWHGGKLKLAITEWYFVDIFLQQSYPQHLWALVQRLNCTSFVSIHTVGLTACMEILPETCHTSSVLVMSCHVIDRIVLCSELLLSNVLHSGLRDHIHDDWMFEHGIVKIPTS